MVELKIFQMPVIKFNTLLIWALSTSSSILFVWWICEVLSHRKIVHSDTFAIVL